jgi:hypothetical protein
MDFYLLQVLTFSNTHTSLLIPKVVKYLAINTAAHFYALSIDPAGCIGT